MQFYYFNNNTDNKGRHEVHTKDCSHQPRPHNRTLIGLCSDCEEALKRAGDEHPSKSFDGCYWCCYECHKG